MRPTPFRMRNMLLLISLFTVIACKRQLQTTVEVSNGNNAVIEQGDSIFPPGNKGAAISYDRAAGMEKFFVFTGEHEGMHIAEIGYRNYHGSQINVIGVADDAIQGAVIDSGKIETGWLVSDPEGMSVQGKDTTTQHYALRVTAGHENFGKGAPLFSVRNDGSIAAGATAPQSTFDVAGSFGAKAITTASDIALGNATTYVFTGTTRARWVLPPLSATMNRMYFIKNRGSASITILCSQKEKIYTSAPVSTTEVAPGKSLILQNDGTYWLVL